MLNRSEGDSNGEYRGSIQHGGLFFCSRSAEFGVAYKITCIK